MIYAPVGYNGTAGFRRLLSICFACGVIAAVSAVSAQAADGDKFTAWTMRCEKPEESLEERCHIFQNAKDESNGQDIAHLAVGYMSQIEEPLMIIMLPLGVFLPNGLELQVDEQEPIRLPFEVCFPVGCRAGAPMQEPLMGAFRNGLTLKLTVQDVEGRAAEIPMSLKGFTAGLSALPKIEGK
jgi:invasion protein IalB